CTNLRGAFADPTAETAVAGLLAIHRAIHRLVELKPTRRWAKLELRPHMQLLTGADCVLLGDGSISRRIRELLAPFHGRTRAYARSSGELRTLSQLDDALSEADAVICVLPLTRETRRFLNAERFAKFKRGAVFVNVG